MVQEVNQISTVTKTGKEGRKHNYVGLENCVNVFI